MTEEIGSGNKKINFYNFVMSAFNFYLFRKNVCKKKKIKPNKAEKHKNVRLEALKIPREIQLHFVRGRR